MDIHDLRKDGEQPPNPEDLKRRVKESALKGFIVFFDMTNSTRLKGNRGASAWVPEFLKFHRLVTDVFQTEKAAWKKFLGDAYMFFFLDSAEKNREIAGVGARSAREILEDCQAVMQSHFEFYKPFAAERMRGNPADTNFREITCAIDWGGDIINWSEQIDDSGPFDPIGMPVDRCFRISSIAGPGQLLVSPDFMQRLRQETAEVDGFEKLSFPKKTLKGFENEEHVYYWVPPEEQINHILSDNQVELIEETKPMSVKAKIRLLRRRIPK